MEIGRAAALAALAFAFAAGTGGAAPRHAPVPGGVAVLTLPAGVAGARFNEAPVLVNAGKAYVGLSLALEPGRHELTLDDGRRLAFVVKPKKYPTQHVRIRDRGKVELSADNETRVAREHAEIGELKKTFSVAARPAIDFVPPVAARRSGVFGARRVFNGQPRAPHVGLDFAAPSGAPVGAAAAGTVLATADYFFNGRSVFVDHGQGLITLYCHLEGIDVTAGQTVAAGERLGTVGQSGRASGPHLHWSVILGGALVDPALFLPPAQSGR